MTSLPPPKSKVPIFLSVLRFTVSFKVLNRSVASAPMVHLFKLTVRATVESSKRPLATVQLILASAIAAFNSMSAPLLVMEPLPSMVSAITSLVLLPMTKFAVEASR